METFDANAPGRLELAELRKQNVHPLAAWGCPLAVCAVFVGVAMESAYLWQVAVVVFLVCSFVGGWLEGGVRRTDQNRERPRPQALF